MYDFRFAGVQQQSRVYNGNNIVIASREFVIKFRRYYDASTHMSVYRARVVRILHTLSRKRLKICTNNAD